MTNTIKPVSNTIKPVSTSDRIYAFLWQHLLLVLSLFLMTLGVALCVRSNLGSSVISSIPYAMQLAGAVGKAPALTIGEYTYIMNGVLVLGQILILRRRFHIVQLCQLVIGFLFGFLLDINMYLTSFFTFDNLPTQIAAQFAGCCILGAGVAFEIRCGSVTMPGEGMPVAISKAFGTPFVKAKICVDISLVVIAILLGYIYFGHWLGNVIGPGTIFAMFFVGIVVRVIEPHIQWFSRIVTLNPEIGKFIYGLARYLPFQRKKH